MTSSTPRIIPAEIIVEVSAMFHNGESRDSILDRMRQVGLNKIECIKLFRNIGGFALGQAKDIVDLSPTWADRRDADAQFQEAAESAFHCILAEDKLTAA